MANGMTKAEEAAYDEGRAAGRSAASTRVATYKGAEAMGFGGTALLSGALGKDGKDMIPEDLMGFDTELILGIPMFLYSRKKTTKAAAYMRGASFALLAGGIKDQGAKLASKV